MPTPLLAIGGASKSLSRAVRDADADCGCWRWLRLLVQTNVQREVQAHVQKPCFPALERARPLKTRDLKDVGSGGRGRCQVANTTDIKGKFPPSPDRIRRCVNRCAVTCARGQEVHKDPSFMSVACDHVISRLTARGTRSEPIRRVAPEWDAVF